MAGLVQDAEAALIGKLASLGLNLDVSAYPEDPQKYRLTHANGALLVKYAGSDYEDTGIAQRLTQIQTVQFDIYVVTRNLKTHTGAYAVIDAVIEGLGGQTITGGMLSPVKDGFLYEDSGIWYHLIIFELKLKVNY